MAERSLDERVEALEQKVGDLEKLPARMDAVESQILQLRGETRKADADSFPCPFDVCYSGRLTRRQRAHA